MRAEFALKWGVICVAFAMAACVPSHRYQPLNLIALDLGQSRTVAVHSSADWRNTGVRVKKGEVYRTSTRGTWSPGGLCGQVTAAGLAVEHLACMKGIFVQSFQMPGARIGALVGKVGRNGAPFLVGGTEGFIASGDGDLFLVMNDPVSLMFDNIGQIEVAIQRYEEGGPALTFTTPLGGAANRTSLGSETGFDPRPASTSTSASASVSGATPFTAKQYGTGFYGAEKDIGFNVLESVRFDRSSGELSIAGRFDPKYAGPHIPYLQHLAVLLETRGPQVSLDWTPQTERDVDTFFRRMDSELEMANLVGSGQLIDSSGKLTRKGKLFLPMFGVKAYNHGNAAGSLGVATRFKETGVVVITRVVPGSAAERAGLKVGNEIHMVTGPDDIPQQPHAPATLLRAVRFAGAGARIMLNVDGYGPKSEVFATLDAYPGDPWEHVSKYDIKARILRIGGRSDVANVLQSLDKMLRLKDTKAGLDSLWFLLYHLNIGDWAEQNRQMAIKGRISKPEFMNRLSRKITEGMETSMNMRRGSMVREYDRARGRGIDGWSALDVAVLELNRQLEPAFKDALRSALHKNKQITMPVAVLDPNANFSPTVRPRYIDLPPDSELARLFVEADYIAKAIIHLPDLSQHISRYKTEYAFTADRPGRVEDSVNRLWIEPARMEVHRSSDNRNLRFGSTEMKINIGRTIGGAEERRDDAYGRFLTGLYDDLAGEFYQLHELREAAKLAVVARWIKAQNPGFKLPTQGRARLNPPVVLEGFITLIWSPQRVKVALIAPGGIDFNVPPIGPSGPVFPDAKRVNLPVDASIVNLSDITFEDIPTVDPAVFGPVGSTAIPARYRRALTQPPVPPSVRLVGLATKGRRTLKRINAIKVQTRMQCDADQSRALHQKLTKATTAARKLAGVEAALNAITAQLPERQRTVKAVNKTLAEEQQRLHDGAMDLATSGLMSTYDELKGGSQMRSIKDLETLIATMRHAKKKLGEISDNLSNLDLAISSAMARSLNERERAQKSLLAYIKDILVDGAKLKGNDATTRALRTVGKTLGVANKIQIALDSAESLYKLADAVQTLERLDAQSEKEVRGLRDSLLPLHKKLLREVVATMDDPVVRAFETGNGRFNCGN